MGECTENIYKYWGKACSGEVGVPEYHLLVYHCLDVAAVGQRLLECRPALLEQIA